MLELLRRRAISVAAAALAVVALGMPAQAAFPEKPITIIVAWGAGGATDLVTRSMQPVLSEKIGADLVVKNVAGAAGTIGTAEAARARPDGYTILITPTGPLTTQPHLRKLPYDFDSFRPIGRIAVTPMLMMVPKTSKYNTLKDVIDDAKANPGSVKFASTGAGTLPHIAILGLNDAAGIDTKHIPYKGSANVMKALLGGEVDVFSDQSQLVPKYDLKSLATWSAERLKDYPDVPTMKELGFDFNIVNWLGMFVPKDVPDDIAAKLVTALEETLSDQRVIDTLTKINVAIGHMPPEAFGEFALSDYARNRKLLEAAGLLKK